MLLTMEEKSSQGPRKKKIILQKKGEGYKSKGLLHSQNTVAKVIQKLNRWMTEKLRPSMEFSTSTGASSDEKG